MLCGNYDYLSEKPKLSSGLALSALGLSKTNSDDSN